MLLYGLVPSLSDTRWPVGIKLTVSVAELRSTQLLEFAVLPLLLDLPAAGHSSCNKLWYCHPRRSFCATSRDTSCRNCVYHFTISSGPVVYVSSGAHANACLITRATLYLNFISHPQSVAPARPARQSYLYNRQPAP